MAVITHLTDDDLYKFSMQRAVLGRYPGVAALYEFIDRRPEGRFTPKFADAFATELRALADLRATPAEIDFLRTRCPFLGDDYLQYLAGYRYDPREVMWEVTGGRLRLAVEGRWERAVLWEVKLLALVSELYFANCDTAWAFDPADQAGRARRKAEQLARVPGPGGDVAPVTFADFGTRRRRSLATHDLVCRTLAGYPHFAGTSNVYLALKHGLRPLGTMAHEWVMGVSALEGLRHADRHAMRAWAEVYRGNLGTALADTFGTAAFWADLDGYTARLFDGVRHDSGDPLAFTDAAVDRYRQLGVDPATKTIIFSDALDVARAARIAAHCRGRVRCSFGIGTHLTNDVPGSRPLNVVIKMTHCDGVPVVKLSDEPGKASGGRDALRVARWTFSGTPLDTPG